MIWRPFGRNKSNVTVVDNADGSRQIITTFTLSGELRPVRDDVVNALDVALDALGRNFAHFIDPHRMQSFSEGGPPVWSVGMVEVGGARPYRLLVTYGFSHILSPEAPRESYRHEYSLALPQGTNPSPWADALLRDLARYVLTSGKELRVGDVLPCPAPITCTPFQPEHHPRMPKTSLVGILTANDPVIGGIETPHGEIEIRRFLGIDKEELDRAETWSGNGFVEEYSKRDPLLLTDLNRASAMADEPFRATVDARAAAEGSEHPVVVLDVSWQDTGDQIVIQFPGERQAQKLLNALRGRLPFGRSLLVISPGGLPIEFKPSGSFGIDVSPEGLVIMGMLDEPRMASIVEFIRPDAPGSAVRLSFEARP